MTEIIKNLFAKEHKSKRNVDFDNIKFYTYTILFIFMLVVVIGSLSGSGEGLKIFEFNFRPIASESANAIYVFAGGIINNLLSEISRINAKLYGKKEQNITQNDSNEPS